MCIRIENRKYTIAKEDIIVYKACKKWGENFYSYYECFKYIPNKRYHSEISFRQDSAGYLDGVERMAWLNVDKNILFIEEGFHSCLTMDRLYTYTPTVTGQFIIPRGSKIWYGRTNLIVSDTIIFTGKIFTATEIYKYKRLIKKLGISLNTIKTLKRQQKNVI